ncbi:ABC transporter ATP-binding protein [Thalassotalea sp. ND16A]|uniref:ABC transporter ATP-binding protein n=1 Tax=Thalassotalea sp. ND16A TaxID=1535422 RepID=UPI00051A4CE2|nr:ABC transporter ATP-binding protein [Thalassotalea sp. ND16A]KGK01022.1 Phosphonate-transporting ATPase [Thalassotalea sp. ND16A]
MLTMNNISKVFQTDEVQTHALRDFHLKVNEGDFISVTGPSGSGKTTFLNIAGLLENFTSGTFMLDDIDISKLNDRDRSKTRNEKIGFIFQSFNLIPDLNLYDNVDVPLRYQGLNAKERKKRIVHHLEMVGLGSRMKHLPSQLSGGQQQRVAIARALATNPRFLLADEPTGNLDTQMAKSVMTLLEEINQQGTTIIMVTHDDDLANRATRKIQIKDGRVSELDVVRDNAEVNATEQAIA